MENNNEKEIFEKLQLFYKEAGWFQEPLASNYASSNINDRGKVYLTFELSEQKSSDIISVFFKTETKLTSHSKPNKKKKKK